MPIEGEDNDDGFGLDEVSGGFGNYSPFYQVESFLPAIVNEQGNCVAGLFEELNFNTVSMCQTSHEGKEAKYGKSDLPSSK